MQTDPTIYIIAAALLSGCISFIAACVLCSRRIRRAEIEGWKDGVRFYQSRENENRRPADFRDKGVLEASHRELYSEPRI